MASIPFLTYFKMIVDMLRLGAIIWNMMKNRNFKCVIEWQLNSAEGELEQANQSLFWAEENAEKRKVDKADDVNVIAGIARVNAAQVRLQRAKELMAEHKCETHAICAILNKSKNGS